MITLKTTIRLFAVSILLISFSSVQAALVNFTLTGEVTFDDTLTGTSIFGLPVGGLVTATGSFDDSLIGGDIISGSGAINVSAITDLSITVGTETFTNFDDDGSGLLTIVNGTAIDGIGSAGFVYAGSNPHLFTSDAGTDTFIGTEASQATQIFGEWTNYEMTVVPVPAAVWLFGSGLLGLVGVARRKVS